MAVIVTSDAPAALLSAIKQAIDDGSVVTWSYDKDGDFSHSPEQWFRLAWLHPRVDEERLVFNILPRKDKPISRTVYAIYHGRFIEMLLTHFDTKFQRAVATAMPTSGDLVKPSGSSG